MGNATSACPAAVAARRAALSRRNGSSERNSRTRLQAAKPRRGPQASSCYCCSAGNFRDPLRLRSSSYARVHPQKVAVYPSVYLDVIFPITRADFQQGRTAKLDVLGAMKEAAKLGRLSDRADQSRGVDAAPHPGIGGPRS